MARTRTSSRIPHGRGRHPVRLRVCAGQRLASQGRDSQLIRPLLIPSPGTREGPQPAFPLVRGPLRTWWVKDSNLRSFRDGFTDQRRHACDQRQCLSPDNFRAYSPQIAGYSRTPPASNSRSRRRAMTSSPTPRPWRLDEIGRQLLSPVRRGRGLALPSPPSRHGQERCS
jgi:hypothetical protein